MLRGGASSRISLSPNSLGAAAGWRAQRACAGACGVSSACFTDLPLPRAAQDAPYSQYQVDNGLFLPLTNFSELLADGLLSSADVAQARRRRRRLLRATLRTCSSPPQGQALSTQGAPRQQKKDAPDSDHVCALSCFLAGTEPRRERHRLQPAGGSAPRLGEQLHRERRCPPRCADKHHQSPKSLLSARRDARGVCTRARVR